MRTTCSRRGLRVPILVCLLLLLLGGVASGQQDTTTDPSLYLSFNEGSGTYILDGSGYGNGGTMYSASRIENSGCGGALLFNGVNSYATIPYNSRNHPEKAITVSSWFYTDSFRPQTLISSYNEGGYRLVSETGETSGGQLILKAMGIWMCLSCTRAFP